MNIRNCKSRVHIKKLQPDETQPDFWLLRNRGTINCCHKINSARDTLLLERLIGFLSNSESKTQKQSVRTTKVYCNCVVDVW